MTNFIVDDPIITKSLTEKHLSAVGLILLTSGILLAGLVLWGGLIRLVGLIWLRGLDLAALNLLTRLILLDIGSLLSGLVLTGLVWPAHEDVL